MTTLAASSLMRCIGRTIFASHCSGSSSSGKCHPFTFSLDVEGGESAHHGMWRLLFDGWAHYGNDLDALVGI